MYPPVMTFHPRSPLESASNQYGKLAPLTQLVIYQLRPSMVVNGDPAKIMWSILVLASLVTAAGLLGLDQRVASWSAGTQPFEVLLSKGTSLLDWLSLKDVSNYLLGTLLLATAGILLVTNRTGRLGWALLYLATVHCAATVFAYLSKPHFGRVRPYDAVDGLAADLWFVGARSFPSGHAAFYAGLFFALVVVLPRWTLLWILPPLFIAVARVVEHEHYFSDVAFSIALAASLALAFSLMLRRGSQCRAPGSGHHLRRAACNQVGH